MAHSYNPTLENLLFRLETRISTLEDALEDTDSDSSSSSISPPQQLSKLPLEEIRLAMAALGPPPAHVFSPTFDQTVAKHLTRKST